MTKKIKLSKENMNNIFYPVYYDGGLLFYKSDEKFYLFRENSLRILTFEEIEKEIEYPSDIDEILKLKNALLFINLRCLSSDQDDPEKIDFCKKIKKIIEEHELFNEEVNLKKIKLKI